MESESHNLPVAIEKFDPDTCHFALSLVFTSDLEFPTIDDSPILKVRIEGVQLTLTTGRHCDEKSWAFHQLLLDSRTLSECELVERFTDDVAFSVVLRRIDKHIDEQARSLR